MGTFPISTHPMVFLLSADEGVLFDPQGKFHGWVMRRHPDGMWVSVRKLEAVDPEDNPLARALSGFEGTDGVKHTDSDTLYFVGALTRIADASKREDGSDIPLGEILREAVKHMEAQANEIGQMIDKMWADRDAEFKRGWNAAKDAMTPPAPWSGGQ